MATFKAIIGRKRADDTYNVRIRVTHNRQLAYIHTDYYVHKDHVRNSKRTGITINDYRVLDKTDALIRRYRRICDENDISDLDAKGIVALVTAKGTEDMESFDFAAYVRDEARIMEEKGRKGTATVRKTAINAFCDVFGSQVIPLSSLTRKAVRQALCRIQGNRAPSLYKAQLQAAYSNLMKQYNDDAQIIPPNPFAGIELPKAEQPKKRALDADTIRSIHKLADSDLHRRDLARDVFMLSFLLVGMNAVDLYNCKEYKNGRIIYERTKTRTRRSDKAMMSVLVPDEAKPLLKKYLDKRESEHVFKFWRMYSDHISFNKALNKGLKMVGNEVGAESLTFYAARHSWATIAVNDCGIDKWTVHLALNHVDPATAVTDIYIKKSWKPVDEANEKVIETLFHPGAEP